MNRFPTIMLSVVLLSFGGLLNAAEKPHAVIVVGTHHYSPQLTMPRLASELQSLGFRTTLINPDWDAEKDQRGLPRLEALEDADVGVFFVRFLKLSDSQRGHITRYVESGKPVVGLRTSTHGFNYPAEHPQHALNSDFGRNALGTPYLIHLVGKTQVQPVKEASSHPILTGVDTAAWESPGTLYLINGQPGIQPLLMGTGNSKRVGKVTNQFGTHELQKTMSAPIAWTWKNKWGGRVFASSLGHVGDFAESNSLRVMVNGIFWAADQPVPSEEIKIQTFTLNASDSGKKAKGKLSRKSPTSAPLPEREDFDDVAARQKDANPRYDGSWKSLQKMPVPVWFDDGKIGIFIHWGPYSAIGYRKGGRGYAEHVPKLLYEEAAHYYPFMKQRWGTTPPEFGYKDIIPEFKAEKWNPDEWAQLFEDVGAKYVVLTAEHHDGWANWDSDLTPWNAVNMGPKRDLVGDLGKAVRKRGLKYAPSYHRERHTGFFAKTKYAVHSEPRPDIAEEIKRHPEAASLYGPFSYDKAFVDDYVARWKEIQDKYHPDFLWVDDFPIYTRDGNRVRDGNMGSSGNFVASLLRV